MSQARLFVSAGTAVATAAAFIVATPSTSSAATTTFNYANATVQSYSVPAGIYAIKVVAVGAGGGGAIQGRGGHGAVVTSYLRTNPGETLSIRVGGGGAGSTLFGGGSGGNATSVMRSTTQLVVAGGGGGTGDDDNNGGDGAINRTPAGGTGVGQSDIGGVGGFGFSANGALNGRGGDGGAGVNGATIVVGGLGGLSSIVPNGAAPIALFAATAGNGGGFRASGNGGDNGQFNRGTAAGFAASVGPYYGGGGAGSGGGAASRNGTMGGAGGGGYGGGGSGGYRNLTTESGGGGAGGSYAPAKLGGLPAPTYAPAPYDGQYGSGGQKIANGGNAALRIGKHGLVEITTVPGWKPAPGGVRALRVAGSQAAPARIVRWQRQSFATQYQVVVRQVGNPRLARKVLLRKTLRPVSVRLTKTQLLNLARQRNKFRGSMARFRVEVIATNSAGAGPVRAKVFAVRR